jgi:putative ABC transport system permease protein
VIAAGVAVIMLDVFEYVTGSVLVESLFTSTWPMAALAGFAVGVGLLAGLYPAFYLSSFPPVRILKGEWTAAGGSGLRSGLVVMQFAIATGLGISCLVIYQQLSYMQSADKGFEHEGVIVIENVDVLGDQSEAFRQEVERHEVVSGSSFAGRTPAGSGVAAYNFRTPDMEESISIQTFRGDEDFLPTLGMRLLEGRNFSGDLASDSSAVILNESAVRVLGLGDEPIGREVNEGQHVIGVVRDFHFQSLREAIEPVAVTYLTGGRQLLLKVGRRDAADFVASLAGLWRQFSPDEEMRYGFLDENFERLAEEERMLSRAVTFFTLLALVIACAGLFGLTAFAVQRRTKEIGIRKVFGATAAAVVVLLSKDVARLVLIAFVAAAPVAFLALDNWLADFAYRIDLGAVPFVLAGGGALALALLTVGYHAIRAASIQPVESLRYE